MLDWTQPTHHPDHPTTQTAPQGEQRHPTTQTTPQQHETGPYPPPDRPCYICGHRAWHWESENAQYQCASGDPAHEERAQWLKEIFPDG